MDQLQDEFSKMLTQQQQNQMMKQFQVPYFGIRYLMAKKWEIDLIFF
jgi:hypothetical protein